MSQTGNREDKRRTPSTLNGELMNVFQNSHLHSPQQHDHCKVQLENAQEVAPFPLGQQWMSEDLIQISVVTGCCIFLCSVLHPLTRITVSLCLWERPPPYLYSTWSFVRVFSEYFSFTTPPQSNSLSRWRLSKKWLPPPLCAPCIAWNLTFFTHTSFFLSFSLCLCFSHSRSSSRVLLWFCPAFCFIISHTRLDKHTLSCLETHTHTHSNADWLDPDVFRHLFSGHLTL